MIDNFFLGSVKTIFSVSFLFQREREMRKKLTCALASDRLRNDLPTREEKQKNWSDRIGSAATGRFPANGTGRSSNGSSSRVAALAEDFFWCQEDEEEDEDERKREQA